MGPDIFLEITSVIGVVLICGQVILPTFSLKLVQITKIINNYQICFVHGQRSKYLTKFGIIRLAHLLV